jgi:hypothetical protein
VAAAAPAPTGEERREPSAAATKILGLNGKYFNKSLVFRTSFSGVFLALHRKHQALDSQDVR